MKLRLAPLLCLAGCATTATERVERVLVPVPQPCVSARPVAPMSLKQQTPDWQDMDVRQKAAATGKWALDQLTYSQKLEAATAACPEVKP